MGKSTNPPGQIRIFSFAAILPQIQNNMYLESRRRGQPRPVRLQMPYARNQATMSETLILSVGIDPLTLCAREAVLRSAGYIVVSAMSIKEAFHLFLDGDFDLMVLCHTLPVRDRERLTCLIRASGSRIPVACISGTPGEQTAFSDATLEENSVEFLAGVRRLLARRFEVVSIGSWIPSGERLAVTAASAPRARRSENKVLQSDVHDYFGGREAS